MEETKPTSLPAGERDVIFQDRPDAPMKPDAPPPPPPPTQAELDAIELAELRAWKAAHTTKEEI